MSKLIEKIRIGIIDIRVPNDKLITVVSIKAKLAILIPLSRLEKYLEFQAN